MSLENQNRDYSSIKDIFRKRASPKKNSSKTKKAPPFSLRLTEEERERLNSQAGNQPLGAYIRSRIFGKDVAVRRAVRRTSLDHQKLALLLAELGSSRLASNMNQLAKAANTGTLDVSEHTTREILEACWAIAQMRELLIRALGLKPEDQE